MADDDQRERAKAEFEHLLRSGIFRVATAADHASYGAPTPTPTPPPDRIHLGIPVTEAIWRFATDPSDRRRFLALNARAHIRSGAVEELLALDELKEYEELKVFLVDDLVRKLVSRELTAHWHPPCTTALEDIPATWWIDARLDCQANTAFSNDTRVTGLLIRNAMRAMQPQAGTPSDTRDTTEGGGLRRARSWTSAQVQAWFKARVNQRLDSPRHLSEANDLAAARKSPGVPTV